MALEGQDIVALTYSDWHASWSTPQQIAVRLAPANRVLYVDVPRSFLYWLKPADPQGAGQWRGPSIQEVRPNLHVYHPPHAFAPVGRLPFAAARRTLEANGRLLARQIRAALRALNMRDPILWNFSPLHGTAIPRLPAKLTIYDICDEWGSYIEDRGGREVTAWIEDRLTRSADLVFVGTENMKARREGLNPEIHVVYHAADYEHFAQASLPDTPVPDDIARLPQPVIGAIGVMDPQRFDVDMIEHIARSRPGWSIALVGPARAGLDLSRLKSCANVYLLGNRPIAELPLYLKGMAVALIPYKVNEATANIYPLKLQEYLASGRPVVSAPLPAILPYQNVVGIAETHPDIVEQIQRALDGDSPERQMARQEVARQNSWEHRVEEKSAHILRRLAVTREGGPTTS
ncbi:MAG: glycosyltransferase [Candidatus Hydrogenedentes bacterium]|nr:glycosyltransferase [Candidatus Hydrogenedentota bacterium]